MAASIVHVTVRYLASQGARPRHCRLYSAGATTESGMRRQWPIFTWMSDRPGQRLCHSVPTSHWFRGLSCGAAAGVVAFRAFEVSGDLVTA